jgi:hypothetical protein
MEPVDFRVDGLALCDEPPLIIKGLLARVIRAIILARLSLAIPGGAFS